MSKKITLPSGLTVTLKDPSKIRYGDRKRLYKSIDIEGSDLIRAMAMNDALIAMLIEEWSMDIPVPAIKIESMDELEIADYDALVEHTKEAQKALFPTLADTPENEADPKAPSANSNA
jgi:translation initiation factor 2 alpha subunit (eIF-2alpha)